MLGQRGVGSVILFRLRALCAAPLLRNSIVRRRTLTHEQIFNWNQSTESIGAKCTNVGFCPWDAGNSKRYHVIGLTPHASAQFGCKSARNAAHHRIIRNEGIGLRLWRGLTPSPSWGGGWGQRAESWSLASGASWSSNARKAQSVQSRFRKEERS